MSLFTQTHRATTALRAAFMQARLPSIEKADKVMPTWEKICNSADRGLGLYGRRDFTLTNPSRATIIELKKLEVIPA